MFSYFDTHCDTACHGERDGVHMRQNGGHVDFERLSKFDRAVQCFSMFHKLALAPAEGMFHMAQRQAKYFHEELAANADIAVQCRSAEEIRKAHEAHKVAAILTIEGSEIIECDPDKLEWANEQGVRIVGLSWNYANFLCGSNRHESSRGLNDLGREFVRRAESYDMRVDVSHCSDAAFWDLMKIATKPVIATHSSSRAICNHPRNLTDDMFRAICDNGGVVGINYWVNFIAEDHNLEMDSLVRNFEHFLDLGGEKYLGLGGDLDGCNPLAGGMKGVQDVPMLYDALKSRGYSAELLEDIFFNNFMRVM